MFGLEGRYSLYNSLKELSFTKTSQLDFLNYNEISLYLNKAIEIRAEKVSEVEFKLMKGDNEVEKNPYLDLLYRPNEFHTGKQFFKLWQKYMDLTGNAFIYMETPNELFNKTAAPKSMHLLRPDRVKINFNEDYTGITSFEYTPEGGQAITYTSDQVLYCFNPDPKCPIKGISILQAGVRAIETGVQLDEYQVKILKNGGRIEGVFKFKNALNKDQLKTLKENYKEEYAGSQKSGVPLFLGSDGEYQNVGLNPAELAYLESKKMSLNDIAILTGVPVAILGSVSDVKFDNADASIAIFLREKIKPALQTLTDFLDWHLIPDGFDLEFEDPTPENIDRTIKLAQAMHDTNSATINEIRESLGLDESDIEGANDILVPFSLSPLGLPAPEPTTPPTNPNADPNADPNAQKKKQAKEFVHPFKDEGIRAKYAELMVKRMDKREMVLLRRMKDYFNGQKTRLLEHIPTKEFVPIDTKSFVDEIFNHRREILIARNTLLPVIRETLISAGKDSFDLTDSRFEFTMTSQIAKWLDDRADLFADEINSTTYKKLKDQFTQAFDNNETREQLINRIESVYSGFDEARARTIARTEVHGATTQGTYEGYVQSGVKTKIWVAVMDDVTRDSHAMADGEEVPIYSYFSNGLFQPGDGGPEDSINCRCVI